MTVLWARHVSSSVTPPTSSPPNTSLLFSTTTPLLSCKNIYLILFREMILAPITRACGQGAGRRVVSTRHPPSYISLPQTRLAPTIFRQSPMPNLLPRLPALTRSALHTGLVMSRIPSACSILLVKKITTD